MEMLMAAPSEISIPSRSLASKTLLLGKHSSRLRHGRSTVEIGKCESQFQSHSFGAKY